MTIIQIVPQLPPVINGLGDYALTLARELRQDFDLQTSFIIGDPTWAGPPEIEGFPVRTLPNRTGTALSTTLSGLEENTLILHYVGYGYARRGCPTWLVNGLQRWRKEKANRRLITVFHELYASSSKPWTSPFWLSPLQKRIAVDLLRLGNEHITNTKQRASELGRFDRKSQHKILTLPVFSTIGEPEGNLPLESRSRRLVIFGHPDSRNRVYKDHFEHVELLCRELCIEEIIDIGIPVDPKQVGALHTPVCVKGVLKAEQISDILADSIAGMIGFPPAEFLAKSTIFAAFCAHGMLPIVTSRSTKSEDGLVANKHYLGFDNSGKELNLQSAQAIAENAYHWYQGHNLKVQAQIYAQCIMAIPHKLLRTINRW